MAFIPVGQSQVNLIFGGTGWPHGGQVVFGVQNDATDAPDVIGTFVAGLVTDDLGTRIPEDVTLESILVKNGPNSTGAFALTSVAFPGEGSGGDVNPNQAILIRKNTALGGRAGRGRMYWPVAEDQVITGGTLNSSPDQVAAMDAAMADLLPHLEAGDHRMMLLHVGSLPVATPVVSLSTQGTTATQRRRLRR